MTREIVEPVGVLGIGVEGRATISCLLERGIRHITALDREEVDGLPASVEKRFGPDHDRELDRFATVFRSPGIRPDHPGLISAKRSGTRITSAVSHFLESCSAPTIGITGTLGKGTCASLTAELLRASGYTTHLGGNIGRSPLEFLTQVGTDDRVVLEISSFQAMDITASPTIGVVLKTTSEHLDWHLDREEYLAAKSRLFRFQGPEDVVVYNADSEGACQVASASAASPVAYSLAGPVVDGISLDGDTFVFGQRGRSVPLPLRREDIRLIGAFNLENIAAALAAAFAAGAEHRAACTAAAAFEGLPHRLEFVTEAGGVRFYNDSYATRPDATIGALQCFRDVPLALILGGSEKFADFGQLAGAIVGHPGLSYVGFIGQTAERMKSTFEAAGPCRFSMVLHEDLDAAVPAAARAVRGGGVVLLSPACASFGLFPNYKVRGERFRDVAKALLKENGELGFS